MVNRPMDVLKKLVLWGFVPRQANRDDGEGSHISVPWSRQTPHFDHLELHGLPFLWMDPIFSSPLTTLVITVETPQQVVPKGTFEQFMNALRTMAPSLVYLTLEGCIPQRQSSTSDEAPRLTRRIPLPSLCRLRILSDTRDCARLMGKLRIDPAAKLEIVVHGRTGTQRLTQVLSPHLSRSAPVRVLNISLWGYSTYAIANHMEAYLDNVDIKDPILTLTLNLPEQPTPQEPPLMGVLRAADKMFSRVKTLKISGLSSRGWDVNWPTLFLRMPSIRILDTTGEPSRGFFKALCDLQPQMEGVPQPEGMAAPTTNVPLARLRELRLERAWFHPDVRDRGRRRCGYIERGLMEELFEWATLRRDHGLPLKTLRLKECGLATAKDVSRLREVVARVKWDRWKVQVMQRSRMPRAYFAHPDPGIHMYGGPIELEQV